MINEFNNFYLESGLNYSTPILLVIFSAFSLTGLKWYVPYGESIIKQLCIVSTNVSLPSASKWFCPNDGLSLDPIIVIILDSLIVYVNSKLLKDAALRENYYAH